MKKEDIKIKRKIIKKFIIEELREERNSILKAVKEEWEEFNGRKFDPMSDELDGERAWEASGRGVLADDIKDGIIPLKEAINLLSKFQKQNIYKRCIDWHEKTSEKEEKCLS